MHIIYSQTDPRDFRVHYVGRTEHMPHRFLGHFSGKEKNTLKSKWLRELGQQGLLPIWDILDKAPTLEEAKAKEAWWIHFYKRMRPNTLVNKIMPANTLPLIKDGHIGVIQVDVIGQPITYIREEVERLQKYPNLSYCGFLKYPEQNKTSIDYVVENNGDFSSWTWYCYTHQLFRSLLVNRIIECYWIKYPTCSWVSFGDEQFIQNRVFGDCW